MAKKEKHVAESNIENIEEALSKSEQFIEDNQKTISIVIAAIIVIVGIYLIFNKMYLKPKQEEALTEMFYAQFYFEQDSFRLALEGDGNNYGFLDIIDQYGMTKAKNLAHYYAGVSYLQLGEFDEAIDQLNSFSTEDPILAPVATGALADAYVETDNLDKAAGLYKKAAGWENTFTTPFYLMKYGRILEKQEKYSEALNVYYRILNEFKSSNEGRYVKKYIARVEMSM